jgi:ketosteroid isomerase-like protein
LKLIIQESKFGITYTYLDIQCQLISNLGIKFHGGVNMKKLFMVLPLVFLLCFAFSCQKAEEVAEKAEPVVDIEAEKVNVKSVIDMIRTSFETEDMEMLSKCFSHDPNMVNFGTDAAERWVGWTTFAEAQKQFFEAQEESVMTIRDVDIKVHKSGEVAWFSYLVDWEGKAMGEPFDFEGARMTGVMEKQNGNWVVVQLHGSIPVSGQAVKY